MFQRTLLAVILSAASVALAQDRTGDVTTPEKRTQANAATERTAEQVQALVGQMTDVTASVEDRWAAEDELMLCDPKLVLPALLEHVDQPQPRPVIMRGYLPPRSGQRDFSANEQVYWSVRRVWQRWPKVYSLANLYLDLFALATTDEGRRACLVEVTNSYEVRGWEVIKRRRTDIALDPNQTIGIRHCATHWMLQYCDDLYEVGVHYMQVVSREDNPNEFRSWFEKSKCRKRQGCDPRLALAAFRAIEAEPKTTYFVATSIERYLDLHFKPDQTDPKYQGQYGVTDAFFEDTVTNALAWWAENKARIEAEAAEWDARPEARGTRDAFKDLANGKLIIQTWGRPPIWEDDAREMMQNRLGLTYEGNFCTISQEMSDYNDAYNLIMESAIRRKHGPDWQAKVAAIREEAKQRWMDQFSEPDDVDSPEDR